MTYQQQEELYGRLWRAEAAKAGHRKALPRQVAVCPSTGLPARIVAALESGTNTTTAIARELGTNKNTVQNYLYSLRTQGQAHSILTGRVVVWCMGPEAAA